MLVRNVLLAVSLVLLVQSLPSCGRGAARSADRRDPVGTAAVASHDELLRVLAERYPDAAADGTVVIEMPLVRINASRIAPTCIGACSSLPVGDERPAQGDEVAILDAFTGTLAVRADDRPSVR